MSVIFFQWIDNWFIMQTFLGGRFGGCQMVSVLAFNSADTSSNPAEVTNSNRMLDKNITKRNRP